ncbi:MAG: FUSC family protein [Dyella sp.]
MSTPKEALKEHRRRLSRLALDLEQLRRSLPPRDRLISGLFQALRTALGASLSYFAARWLGMEQGYWAAITAISVMQNSYVDVKSSSRDQFIGALIGALIGLAAAVLGHDHYLAYLLAVMAGVVFCWLANLGNAGRISGVTTTIIMLVPQSGTFGHIALLRLGEVVVGALAALLVTRLLSLLTSRLLGPAIPPAG